MKSAIMFLCCAWATTCLAATPPVSASDKRTLEVNLNAAIIWSDVIGDKAADEAHERARATIAGMGPQADFALAAIIVERLKLKREGDPTSELEPTMPVFLLVRYGLNDPKLVPLLLRPLVDWLSYATANPNYDPDPNLTEEAATYLMKWGDDKDRAQLAEQARSLTSSSNPNLNAAGKRLQRISDGTWRKQYGIPKGAFHEWCDEMLVGKKISAANTSSPGTKLPESESPQANQPKLKEPAKTTPTPIEKSDRGWLVWLAVVVVATGGAVWLFLRKSSM